MSTKRKTSIDAKVELTDETRQKIKDRIGGTPYKEYSAETGIPVQVLSNLVTRNSFISHSNYVTIFGVQPGPDELVRVDGLYFRQLVSLWQHQTGIKDDDVYSQLSSENGADKSSVRRMVSGAVQTVDRRLEDIVEKKLSGIGIEKPDLETAIKQNETGNPIEKGKRYSYAEIKQILDYLKENFRISPSKILGRNPAFYIKNETATISGEVYRYAESFMEKGKQALSSGSAEQIKNLRIEVYGRDPLERIPGGIPYQAVRQMLDYLESKGVNSRELLGRSRSRYDSLKLKVVPVDKYENVVRAFYERGISAFMNGDIRERRILSGIVISTVPNSTEEDGFTSVGATGNALGINQLAFDLLVAENSPLFRGIFVRRVEENRAGWYTPNPYIAKLKENLNFNLLREGYELLAKK